MLLSRHLSHLRHMSSPVLPLQRLWTPHPPSNFLKYPTRGLFQQICSSSRLRKKLADSDTARMLPTATFSSESSHHPKGPLQRQLEVLQCQPEGLFLLAVTDITRG
jgi:hypothetical protein